MKAYLWDRQGRPVATVNIEDPYPRTITIPTADPRFERQFWRLKHHTTTDDARDVEAPLRPKIIGMDYEEDEQSPRRVECPYLSS